MRSPESSRDFTAPEAPKAEQLPGVSPRNRAVRARVALLAPFALLAGCSATNYELGREDARAVRMLIAEHDHFEAIGRAKRLRGSLVKRAESLMAQGTEESAVAARSVLDKVIELDQSIARAYAQAATDTDKNRQSLEADMARIAQGTGVEVPAPGQTHVTSQAQSEQPAQDVFPEETN